MRNEIQKTYFSSAHLRSLHRGMAGFKSVAVSRAKQLLKWNSVPMVVAWICTATVASVFVDSDRAFGQQVSMASASQTAEPLVVAPIRRARVAPSGPVSKVDWTTMASSYSHDESGQRVDQYNSGVVPSVEIRPDYVKSGFRHTRSTLQAGFSSDNYHEVEQWGSNVRPYGEWRYPNRPFAVPYGMWGPQLPQVFGGGGVIGYPTPWGGSYGGGSGAGWRNFGATPGFPGGGESVQHYPGNVPLGGNGVMSGQGMHPGFGVGPWNALTPTQDDYYPQAPILQNPTNSVPSRPHRHSFGLQ